MKISQSLQTPARPVNNFLQILLFYIRKKLLIERPKQLENRGVEIKEFVFYFLVYCRCHSGNIKMKLMCTLSKIKPIGLNYS